MLGTTDQFVWMPWKPNDIAPPDDSTLLVMIGLSLCMTSDNGLFGYEV
jgi:hypothetical protein